ncbi:Mitogen-activated protein kinase kinase [Trichinella pseudospiralis]
MSEEADKVKSKRPSRSEILSRGIDKCISLCTDQLDMSKRKNDFESLQLTEREKETLTKGFMEKKAAAIEKLTEGFAKLLPADGSVRKAFYFGAAMPECC